MVERSEDLRSLVVVVVFATCTMACAGESASSDERDGSSQTKGGSTSSGGTSSGGSGSGSGGSSGSLDCTGDFGTPRVVLEVAETSFSGLTVSPDELELVYGAESTTPDDIAQRFFRARRASKADVFSDPVALPELDAACLNETQMRSGDLSSDGLRFYFTCDDSSAPSATPLRLARRVTLDAPFVVDPDPIGYVRGGPTVTTDELELFASLSDGPAGRYYRSNVSEPFTRSARIAGLESLVLLTPEIAPNGLELFVSQPTLGLAYTLQVATRSDPDAAFEEPRVLLPEVMNEIFTSPTISNDCRSLYFVHGFALELTYRVEVMSR